MPVAPSTGYFMEEWIVHQVFPFFGIRKEAWEGMEDASRIVHVPACHGDQSKTFGVTDHQGGLFLLPEESLWLLERGYIRIKNISLASFSMRAQDALGLGHQASEVPCSPEDLVRRKGLWSSLIEEEAVPSLHLTDAYARCVR